MRASTIAKYEKYREYKRQGHTNTEVAKRFGISEQTAQRACAGIAPQGITEAVRDPTLKRNQWVSSDKTLEEHAEELIAERTPWFEYVGGFTNSNGSVELRCKKCGAIVTKAMVSIRHAKATCDNCRKKKADKERAKKEKAKAEQRAARETERAKRKQENEAKRIAYIESITHACTICGAMTTNKYCCSQKCSRKRADQIKEVSRRAKLKAAMVDKTITLQSVYEKDKGVCYICGGVCDWEDKEERDACVVCGNRYPSIDHVVPLAKGGLHAWDNVRLAHRYCNTLKRDTI